MKTTHGASANRLLSEQRWRPEQGHAPGNVAGKYEEMFSMTGLVYRRPASKRRVAITPTVEADALALIGAHSQNEIARRLGISQSAVSRVARRNAHAAQPSQSISTDKRETA
jgi:DNA invertase Pin-like site-specific DNA recombinase